MLTNNTHTPNTRAMITRKKINSSLHEAQSMIILIEGLNWSIKNLNMFRTRQFRLIEPKDGAPPALPSSLVDNNMRIRNENIRQATKDLLKNKGDNNG